MSQELPDMVPFVANNGQYDRAIRRRKGNGSCRDILQFRRSIQLDHTLIILGERRAGHQVTPTRNKSWAQFVLMFSRTAILAAA
jgi:hypothetical protein